MPVNEKGSTLKEVLNRGRYGRKYHYKHCQRGTFREEVLDWEEFFWRKTSWGIFRWETYIDSARFDCGGSNDNWRKSGVYIAPNCRAFRTTWLLLSRCINNLSNNILTSRSHANVLESSTAVGQSNSKKAGLIDVVANWNCTFPAFDIVSS